MFYYFACATAIATLLLGLGWLFAGPLLIKRWGLVPEPQALMVGRRLGAVYFGVSIIMWLGRNAPASELRDAVMVGALFTLMGLAVLGVHAYKTKQAGAAILISVAVEIVLSVGFAWVLFA